MEKENNIVFDKEIINKALTKKEQRKLICFITKHTYLISKVFSSTDPKYKLQLTDLIENNKDLKEITKKLSEYNEKLYPKELR
jgi:hypothetical protein